MSAHIAPKKEGYRPDGPFVWMSLAALEAIDRSLPEPLSAHAVYAALCRIVCRSGKQDPVIEGYSVAYLAKMSNLCKKTTERRLSDLKRIGLISITPKRVRTPDGAWINSTNTYVLNRIDPRVTNTPGGRVTENDFEVSPVIESRSYRTTGSTSKKEAVSIAEQAPQNAMNTPEIPKAIKQPSKPIKEVGKSTDPKIDDVIALAASEFLGLEADAVRWLEHVWPSHWDMSLTWSEALRLHLLQTSRGRR